MTEALSEPKTTSTRDSVVMGLSALAGGVMNAMMLAISARHGQLDEIAAYTVMTSALAFVAIATGGGAALLYAAGDSHQRQAIRSQWMFVILPGLLIGIMLIGSLYAHWGYRWSALLAAGVVAIGNNLAQLQYADLTRQMLFRTNAVIVCLSKVPALVLLVGGASLTKALVVATVVQLILTEIALHRTSWLRPAHVARLSPSEGFTALWRHRQLFGYTLSEVYTERAVGLVLSIVAPPRIVGCYGAVTAAYQAVAGVLHACLRVPLAVRVRERLGLGAAAHRARDGELVAIAGGIAAGATLFVSAPWITRNVLMLPIPAASDWLRILSIALPCAILVRIAAYTFIGDGDYRQATKVLLLVAIVMTPIVTVAVPMWGPIGAVCTVLCSEFVAAVVIGRTFIRRVTV